MNRPELRIGDLERDAALTALGEHYALGRLTKDEYDARADVVWRARTGSDLAPLFADLPALPQPQSQRGSGPGGPPPGRTRRSRPPVIPVLLLVIVVAALTGLEVWPFVLLVGVYLWLRTWMGLASLRRWFLAHVAGGGRGRAVEPWRRPTPWH
ncbi:MAG TPA: DUF1707 domain-containing protein [Nocardioidaceae bacterium]